MIAYEKICQTSRPDWIIVVGDVNPTAACALVGAKLWIPVVHLQAGLRTGDRRMPEEINRLVTDAIANVLWTPSADANANLAREGVAADRIDLIGNILIDSFEMLRGKIEDSTTRRDLGLTPQEYGLVTLHRPYNVDQDSTLIPIVDALTDCAKRLPMVFVAHPRTIGSLEKLGLKDKLTGGSSIQPLEPLPYISFMNAVTGSRVVITDSGGLQEETTYLDIPCLAMRENTERPITITQGTNRLVRADNLAENLTKLTSGAWPRADCPPYWDGKSANRVVESLRNRL